MSSTSNRPCDKAIANAKGGAVLNEAILANIEALHAKLGEALTRASLAREAMRDGQRNLAIGTILECEHTLPECEALFRTALLLHRSALREVTP